VEELKKDRCLGFAVPGLGKNKYGTCKRMGSSAGKECRRILKSNCLQASRCVRSYPLVFRDCQCRKFRIDSGIHRRFGRPLPIDSTWIKGKAAVMSESFAGTNFHFGIREHGMGSILNRSCTLRRISYRFGATLLWSFPIICVLRSGCCIDGIAVVYVFTHVVFLSVKTVLHISPWSSLPLPVIMQPSHPPPVRFARKQLWPGYAIAQEKTARRHCS